MKKLLGIFVSIFMIGTLFMMLTTSCLKEEVTTGRVIVTNYTSSTLIVDVNDGAGNWLGERRLGSGSSATYSNVEAGVIDGAARFANDDYWYNTTDYYYLEPGGTVTIDWVNTKSATIEQKQNIVGGDKGSLIKISKK